MLNMFNMFINSSGYHVYESAFKHVSWDTNQSFKWVENKNNNYQTRLFERAWHFLKQDIVTFAEVWCLQVMSNNF